MKADGFSLDDKRNPIVDNDIPDVIARFKNLPAEEKRTRKDQSFLVPVEEIRQKGYDLSINKYKEVEKVKVEYEKPEVVFDRVETLQKEIAEAMDEFRTKYL
jgi:type I restriction enzyme M protein